MALGGELNLELLAAMELGFGIGFQGRLPWPRIPTDLHAFRRRTETHNGRGLLIMGRGTWESLPGPLPGRTHLILSRNRAYTGADTPPGVGVLHSVEAVLQAARLHRAREGGGAFVIGGAAIYELFLPHVRRMHLTLVAGRYPCDTHFPSVNPEEWRLEHSTDTTDPITGLGLTFLTLSRR